MSDTLAQLLREAAQRLEQAGLADSGRDARALVALAAGLAPGRLTLHLGDPPPPGCADRLGDLLARRCAREPLSHLTGRRAFWKDDFCVNADVLDPRPDTEVLVETALGKPFGTVLDLGTGSGCILLSLLRDRPDAIGVGTDVSQAALRVAQGNADRLGLGDRATFVHGDWYERVTGRFDLIVSNPPYIALSEMPGLAPELAHEPRAALTDEGDGLGAYRVIVPGAGAHLHPGGRLCVEIGPTQGAGVAALFAGAGFTDVAVVPDLDGRDRVVAGVVARVSAGVAAGRKGEN